MTEASEQRLHSDIQEIKESIARITTVIEERQFRCNDHGARIERTEGEIVTMKHALSGLKAWITTAGVIGGVVGWVSNVFLGGR